MQPCPDDLRDTDLLTRVIARCGVTEVMIGVCAVVFALAAGLLAPL
jgi:hypothetical protein